MKSLIIGLDVDNVIYPYSTVMARWVERRKGLPPGSLDDVALSWTWYKDQWGIDTEEFMAHFVAGVKAGVIYRQGCPAEGALAAARRLHDAGHHLIYVTDRAIPGVTEHEAAYATMEWLMEHGFPTASRVYVTGDKASVYTDVFLDDKPANVEALMAAGTPYPLLWDRPHNRAHSTLDGRRAMVAPGRSVPLRIHDWHGFGRVVNTIADEFERAA